VFTAEASSDAVTQGRSALSPLFAKANGVITAFREADERMKKSKS
jgi:hypothetical protein